MTSKNTFVPSAQNNAALLQEAQRLSQLLETGRAAEGEAVARALLAKHPDWGLGWKLLTAFCYAQGRYQDGLDSVRRAAPYFTNDSELFNLAGLLYRETGQLVPAITCMLKAVELTPVFPEAYNNLGGAFIMKGELDNAVAALVRAVQQAPRYPEAHQNLGSALLAKGLLVEAIPHFFEAAQLQPAFLQALILGCYLKLQCADWVGLDEKIHALHAALGKPRTQSPNPFVLVVLPGTSRAAQRLCGERFAQEQYAGFFNHPALNRVTVAPRQRLRIGYLSADFHEHATSYLLAGVLEAHDPERVEVFGYSYGPDDGSPIRQRIEKACVGFRNLREVSHEAAAQQIAADAVDILIDLKGFTEHARPQIAALRPAPLVVNWLGYPGTVGHPGLADYIIGDPVVTPLAHEGDYSEVLALLPECYQPNDRARVIGPCPTRAEAGLPETGLVFCSFNQIYKIAPEVFDVWCRILKAVPDGVLWLFSSNATAIANLKREAVARGVAAERLIFAAKLPQAEHLGRLQLADLALDTFPCTSHTTASDALWAGVPLVTKIGDSFVSRVAASLLQTVSLPQCVTEDWDAYVETVCTLANDPAALAALKDHLRSVRDTTPLFDTPRFTRHLEALFFAMWEQKCQGVRQSFALPPLV